MRTIPVDLIIHSLAERLAEHPSDEVPGLYADPVARCIDHRRLAEEWTHGAGVEQHARWFVKRLSGEDMGLNPDHHMVSGDTRAIEVAVARRLADHAFALTIEQDAEATVRASTLLRAACAVVGLARIETVAARPAESPAPETAATANDDDTDLRIWRIWAASSAVELETLSDAELRANVDAKFRNTAVVDALTRERDGQAALLKTIRKALGAGDHDDIARAARHEHALAEEANKICEFMSSTYRGPFAAPAGTAVSTAVVDTITALADAYKNIREMARKFEAEWDDARRDLDRVRQALRMMATDVERLGKPTCQTCNGDTVVPPGRACPDC